LTDRCDISFDKKNKKVYIIIINYNTWQDTIECIESIFQSDYVHYQIIIVDNNSSNNSIESIKRWANGYQGTWKNSDCLNDSISKHFKNSIPITIYSNVELMSKTNNISSNNAKDRIFADNEYPLIIIRNWKNLGFAAGNNVGIKYALSKGDAEYFWILNNDTVIKKNSLKNLVCCFEKKSGEENSYKIALSTKIISYYNRTKIDNKDFKYLNVLSGWVTSKKRLPSFFYYKYIDGASLFLSKYLPLMDESYFLYFDDVQYSKILNQEKYCFYNCKDSIVYHKVSSTTRSTQDIIKIQFQSLITFYKKNYPVWLISVLLIRVFYYLLKLKIKYIMYLINSLFAKKI